METPHVIYDHGIDSLELYSTDEGSASWYLKLIRDKLKELELRIEELEKK